jgi:hypothetical protein
MAKPQRFPKAEVMDAVRHAHYPQDVIDEIDRQFPDPVDYDRDQSLLLRYGITFDQLIDRLGGSP